MIELTDINFLLIQLEKTISFTNSKGYLNLQNGIDLEEFKQNQNLELLFSEDLIAFYKWRNGTAFIRDLSLDQLEIFDGGIFYPIEFSIEVYSYFSRFYESKFLPICGNGDTINYTICLDKESSEYNSIFYEAYFIDEPIKMFHSLKGFLGFIIECYESRAYEVNADGKIVCDLEKEKRIRSKYFLK